MARIDAYKDHAEHTGIRTRTSTNSAALALAILATGLFVVSAFMGLWLAHDQEAARAKFTLLSCGLFLALAVAEAGRDRASTVVGIAGVGCALAGATIGLIGDAMGPGDAGSVPGGLLVLVALACYGLIWTWNRRYTFVLVVVVIAMLVGVVAVVRTGERAVFAGLIAGVLFAAWAGWRFEAGRRSWGFKWFDASMIVCVCGLLFIYSAAIVSPSTLIPMGSLLPATVLTHFGLWHDALAIVQDYLYTGSGLGGTPMVLASYLYLSHVPLHHHVHNLFLQIAIEQGIVGLIAFVGMTVAGLWAVLNTLRYGGRRNRAYGLAGGATIVALTVYGMYESDLYNGRLVFLLFLPFGLVWAMARQAVRKRRSISGSGRIVGYPVIIGLLASMAVLAVPLLPRARAQLFANLGAASQTWVELTAYEWPRFGIQDQVRRNKAVDLASAVDFYRGALVLDPYNVTAHRRLGQIYLSWGDYVPALNNLESAYSVAPNERATRVLLGEAYAATGNIERARQLWQRSDNDFDVLTARLWWYQHLGSEDEAQRIRTVIASLE